MAEFEVTGVRYQMGDNLTMEERTQAAEEFIKTLRVGEPMILAAEPDNPKDSEAIAVYRDFTRRVGYIKHESCKDIKPLLDVMGQCDAVVSGDDGHVTFFVEIPNAPENMTLATQRMRVLPDSPLPQGIGLAFSDEERALQIVAPRIATMKLTAENIDMVLSMVERYMPLSAISLSYDDDYWRDRVHHQLRKATRMKLPEEQKLRVKQLCDQMHHIIGNFHRTHEHPQQQVFERQLEQLRTQSYLFEKFEKYASLSKDGLLTAVCRLRAWFEEMPHVELRDPRDHAILAEKLSYMSVSRRELYDVYAAVLLLEKYGNDKSQQELVEKLKPIFYGSESDAEVFLSSIKGMKPKQITDKVNQMVREKKISEMSSHRDLWKVLHDSGIYTPTESNWNQQVK